VITAAYLSSVAANTWTRLPFEHFTLQIRGDIATGRDPASSCQAVFQQGKLYGKDHGSGTLLAEVESATEPSGLSCE
jgi:hypothetical protein